MGSETKSSRIWIRFESKKQDGEIVKLRIQDLPSNRLDDLVTFYTTHFIKDEAFHKAAGIVKNAQAIEEYKTLITSLFEVQPLQVAICCFDDDSKDFDKILAISTVGLASKESSMGDILHQLGVKFQTKEMESLFHILLTLEPKFPKELKDKYHSYHEGRGIIVHPDYRGLGIASQIVKQRRLLIQEDKIPMTCAWMTSMGSQKAAQRDGWETVTEISLEELDELTGYFFVKDVPSFKLMFAAKDC